MITSKARWWTNPHADGTNISYGEGPGSHRRTQHRRGVCPRRPVLAAVVVAAMPARKTKSLSRAKRPSLIAPGDVEDVFDDHAVELLARMAKLPPNADVARFATALRVDVHNYLQAKRRLGIPQLRAAIERLYQLNKRAEHGNDRAAGALARAVSTMSADTRNWLAQFCPLQTNQIPTGGEIISPATRQSAIQRLRAVLSRGGSFGIGRNRPGGKRSRTFKPLLNVPTGIKRERPRGEAQREFVRSLALTYSDGTGKKPPYTARDAVGPFCNFVSHCFELAGASSGNVPRLINEFGKARRESRELPVSDICMIIAQKK